MSTQQIGNAAESLARQHLERHHCQILEQNFSCKMGEIDLIAIDDNTLVFVEVRLRTNPNHGSGADSVTRSKRRRIARTAEYYLMRHPIPGNLECRFDVISMDNKIDWIQNAFTLDDC